VIGPWATAERLISLSGFHTDDGKAILVIAAFAIVLLLADRAGNLSRSVAIVLFLVIGAAAANDGIEIAAAAQFSTLASSQIAVADWGTYAIVLGAALAIVGLAGGFDMLVTAPLAVAVVAVTALVFYWIEVPPQWAVGGGTILH
jgi:hypothetical protein